MVEQDRGVVVAVEDLSKVRHEAGDLLVEHWRELATYDFPLEPDWDFYEKAAAIGLIRLYTARLEGQLVGYAAFIIRKNPHYSTTDPWAVNDLVWLHPKLRGWGIGRQMAEFWEKDLRAYGISVIRVDAKAAHQRLVHMLARLGYNIIVTGLEKRLV
jgi:GNAT superfamily N-acetyltransferase